MVGLSVRPQLLSLYPVLTKIPPAELEAALENSYVKSVSAGTLLWDETYRVQHFPFVLKGRARIVKLAASGRELHLYSVKPGGSCVIATSSLVGGTRSDARAIADLDLQMIILPISAFKVLIEESAVFRDYVFADLSDHMTQLTQLVSAIAFQNLDQRLAASLVAKANPIQITHQALADELGSVRENISRLLKNFADRGWIALQRGQISVLNALELTEFSKPDSAL